MGWVGGVLRQVRRARSGAWPGVVQSPCRAARSHAERYGGKEEPGAAACCWGGASARSGKHAMRRSRRTEFTPAGAQGVLHARIRPQPPQHRGAAPRAVCRVRPHPLRHGRRHGRSGAGAGPRTGSGPKCALLERRKGAVADAGGWRSMLEHARVSRACGNMQAIQRLLAYAVHARVFRVLVHAHA